MIHPLKIMLVFHRSVCIGLHLGSVFPFDSDRQSLTFAFLVKINTNEHDFFCGPFLNHNPVLGSQQGLSACVYAFVCARVRHLVWVYECVCECILCTRVKQWPSQITSLCLWRLLGRWWWGGGTSCLNQPSDWIRPLIYLQTQGRQTHYNVQIWSWIHTAEGDTEHWGSYLGINFSFLPTSDRHSCFESQNFFLFCNIFKSIFKYF